MSAMNTEGSGVIDLPLKEHVEADGHTDKGHLEDSLDDIDIRNKFFRERASAVSSALKGFYYDRAFRLAVELQKHKDVPLECSVTCFWAMALASKDGGELVLAQEYIEMYINCIDDLIKIDADQNLPVDKSKPTLKTIGQQSLDEVKDEIEAEIKAREAIDHTDSSEDVLYIKGKGKETKMEEKKATRIKGERKRRNAGGEDSISRKQLATEWKALFEHAAVSTIARQDGIPIKARAGDPRLSPYESLITRNIEHAVESDSDDDDKADRDEDLIFPFTLFD